MKTIALGLSFLLSILVHRTYAQAYWVIETNARQKNFTIVRFYNQQHELIYEERQLGVFLNPAKRRHKKVLDAMLNAYLMTDSFYSRKEGMRSEGKNAKPGGL